MKARLLISILAYASAIFLSGAVAYAQDRTDYDIFSSSAREQMMIFRGRQATLYTDILYNGHYFWASPQFKKGEVSYNGRIYHDILLNIDAADDCLIAKPSEEMPAVVVDADCVPWFTMGADRFVNLRLNGMDVAPGFYQQLSSGDNPVYMKVHKTLVRGTERANGALIGYDDPDYDDGVFAYFRIESRYYWMKDGMLKKISRRKALKLAGYGE